MADVNLVLQMNAGGLGRDAKILEEALLAGGNRVTVTAVPQMKPRPLKLLARALQPAGPRLYGWVRLRPRYDVNIFLEHIWSNWTPTARRNCFVPNPEWVRPACEPLIEQMDVVLCKTRHSVEIFEKLGAARTEFISFTSLDRRNGDGAKRSDELLHLACGNSQKGTQALIDAWRQHPEWPHLQIVNAPRRLLPIPDGPNYRHVGRLPEEDLLRAQNEHDVHLCPSEVEGWGHSIVESASVGAVVLTTDAPPMNELVRPERGVLVAHRGAEAWARGTKYFPDPDDLSKRIEEILSLTGEQRRSLGDRARSWFEENDALFRTRLAAVMHAL